MKLCIDTFATWAGPFTVAVDAHGAVAGTAFGGEEALRSRLAPYEPCPASDLSRSVREQLLAYFAGERREFTLPLAPRGTPFQQRVWSALQAIPFGETRSYGELARQLANPTASRAVGRANATNPICLLIPCHRVIGADGSLTGFAFGTEIKRRLLDHERSRERAFCAA